MLQYQVLGEFYYKMYGNVFAAQLLVCLVCFLIYQPRRSYFKIRAFLSVICYFAFVNIFWLIVTKIDSPLPISNIVFYFLTTFFMGVGVFFAFRTDVVGTFYLATAAYAVQHTAYALGNIVKSVFAISWPFWVDRLVFDFLIFPVVGLIFFYSMIRPNRKKFIGGRYDWRILLISLVILIICVVLSTVTDNLFTEYAKYGVVLKGMRICCSIYAIVGGTSSVLLQIGFMRENKLSDDNAVLDQLLHSEKKWHELSKETIDIINVKCHDLKHQISRLANIDDREARSSYIQSIQSSIAIYDSAVQTGNDALDIVIAEKSLICDGNKISFSCLVAGDKLAFMDSADIASLFGNALDNAIERELQEPEDHRFISFTVKTENGFLHIHIDNYCSSAPEFYEGLPRTTKEDKLHHGFGTKIIKSIVQKYNGELFMEFKNERFNMDILFNT